MSPGGEDAGSARRLVARLPALEISGKSVLDLRCGGGEACLLFAQRGAGEILGVDARDLSAARTRLDRDDPELRSRLRFEQVGPGAWTPRAGWWDLVLLRGGFSGHREADGLLAQVRAALAPAGSAVIEFSAPRRFGRPGGEDAITLEQFAAVMARSRLHCTWYRNGFPRSSTLSLWRQPLYG